jgi:hypothetical protein
MAVFDCRVDANGRDRSWTVPAPSVAGSVAPERFKVVAMVLRASRALLLNQPELP